MLHYINAVHSMRTRGIHSEGGAGEKSMRSAEHLNRVGRVTPRAVPSEGGVPRRLLSNPVGRASSRAVPKIRAYPRHSRGNPFVNLTPDRTRSGKLAA